MGNSLHNKIYLGRRAALYNLPRMAMAGACTALVGAAAIICTAAKLVGKAF